MKRISIAALALLISVICSVAAVSAALDSSAYGTMSPSSTTVQDDLVGTLNVGIVGHPTICSQPGTGTYDIFVQGGDNHLYTRHVIVSGAWSAWKDTNVRLGGPPSAVSRAPGAIDVFFRAQTGQTQDYWTTDGGNKWVLQDLGGQVFGGTSPGAYHLNNKVGCFVTGTDKHLWLWNGGTDWKYVGGDTVSSPCAVSPATNALTVWARGTDTAIWSKTSLDSGKTFQGWSPLGGKVLSGTGPATVLAGTKPDVFVIGLDKQPYVWTGGTSWRGIGGQCLSSPAAASHKSNCIDVVVIGTNHLLYVRGTTAGSGGSWSAWRLEPA